jgi:hypothetical protein
MGEVVERDGALRGIAVHLAARVMSAAAGGEVLVSETVKDIVAGSALRFQDRGTHQLKGIEGERRLFAVLGDQKARRSLSPGWSLVDGGECADMQSMTRAFGLTALLVSLLIGGYLFLQQSKTAGPGSPAATQAETQAQAAVAATNFQGMASVLQGWYASNGTYVGATLPPGSGVTLVHADAASYCLETIGSATATMHETGPNGTPQPGAC